MSTKTTGIYEISSIKKPARFYIGSAIDIQKRWKRHLQQQRKGKHGNRFLQSHFDKYGEDDLRFEILHTCAGECLIEKEQKFMDALKPSFNLCPAAGSRLGFIIPFAHRQKIKASWLYRAPISAESRLLKKRP